MHSMIIQILQVAAESLTQTCLNKLNATSEQKYGNEMVGGRKLN